jgi:PPM family protein phosphatase
MQSGCIEVECGAKSDTGRKRTNNEDRFCVDSELGLYVVCDGMGGEEGGEVASQLAIQTIHEYCAQPLSRNHVDSLGVQDHAFLPLTNRLASAVIRANEVIHREAQSQPRHHGMGTTVVSAFIHGPIASIAHVGDSRMYLVRGDSIKALTIDHSLVSEQVRAGVITEDQAEWSDKKHVLTRALGTGPTVEVELGEIPVKRGDILVLCSDGLTREINPFDILRAVRRSPNLQVAADDLIDMANASGGQDNTTVILVAIRSTTGPGLLRRMLARLIYKRNGKMTN